MVPLTVTFTDPEGYLNFYSHTLIQSTQQADIGY